MFDKRKKIKDLEERIKELETRIEHHADMIYNKLAKKYNIDGPY